MAWKHPPLALGLVDIEEDIHFARFKIKQLYIFDMQRSLFHKDLRAFLIKTLTRGYYYQHQNALPLEEAIQVLSETAGIAGWDIDTILKIHMAEVKNEDIRQLFRRFLIAKKYSVRLFDMTQQGAPPAIVYASDDCVLINIWKHVTSTRVLSPTGEILIPEGSVIFFPNTISYFGFVVMDVTTRKMGMYTKSGQEVLPCVFDNVTRKGELSYEGVSFNLHLNDLAIRAISGETKRDRTIKYIYGNGQVAGIAISHERVAAEIIAPGVRRIIENPEPNDGDKVNSALDKLRVIIGKSHDILDEDETKG